RQLGGEELLLPARAAEDDALDARIPQTPDLVRRKRPAGDGDKRLRLALSGIAEPLGLPAGEDDRLHVPWPAYPPAFPGAARPIASYRKPAASIAAGSSMLRPSISTGVLIVGAIFAQE